MAPLEVSMHVAARALQTAPLRTAAMQERWTWGRSKVSGSCSPPPREVSIQYPLWRPGNCVFYLQKKKKKIAFLRIGGPDRRNVNSKLFPEVSVNVRSRMDASRPMFIHLQLLFDVSTHRGCLLLTLTQELCTGIIASCVAKRIRQTPSFPPLSHPTLVMWEDTFQLRFPPCFSLSHSIYSRLLSGQHSCRHCQRTHSPLNVLAALPMPLSVISQGGWKIPFQSSC